MTAFLLYNRCIKSNNRFENEENIMKTQIDSVKNLKAFVPAYFDHFIETFGIVTINQLVELEPQFVMLSYDHDNMWYLVGTIDKAEDEDNCFNDQHRNFDTLEEATEEFYKVLKNCL